MELDLQSLLGSCVQLYSLAETPHPPPHLGSYTRALLVSKDRRHLFVTLLDEALWTRHTAINKGERGRALLKSKRNSAQIVCEVIYEE
jgi:hypothetical protein